MKIQNHHNSYNFRPKSNQTTKQTNAKDDKTQILPNQEILFNMDSVAQAIFNGNRRRTFKSIDPDVTSLNIEMLQAMDKSYYKGYMLGMNKNKVIWSD